MALRVCQVGFASNFLVTCSPVTITYLISESDAKV
jgi:hypothetical protein